MSSVPSFPPFWRYPMTGSDAPDGLVPQSDTAAALVEGLAGQLGSRASVSAVFGEPVTSGGITVIPVAEVGFGFAGGTGSEAGAVNAGQGGGGAGARPRGYVEIKDGTATCIPLRAPLGECRRTAGRPRGGNRRPPARSPPRQAPPSLNDCDDEPDINSRTALRRPARRLSGTHPTARLVGAPTKLARPAATRSSRR